MSTATLRRWALRARRRLSLRGRIGITIVSADRSRQLNARYRRRRQPTNVLSFDYAHQPAAGPDDILAGEVVLCPIVIRREARLLKVPYPERMKMLLEHGLIHLLGLDHATARQQQKWERYTRRLK